MENYLMYGLVGVAVISFFIIVKRNFTISKYKKMSERYPKFADIRLKTAEILEGYGILEDAEVEYMDVIKLYPGHLEARLSLSTLYVKMKKKELARQQLKEIIERCSDKKRYYHIAVERLYKIEN